MTTAHSGEEKVARIERDFAEHMGKEDIDTDPEGHACGMCENVPRMGAMSTQEREIWETQGICDACQEIEGDNKELLGFSRDELQHLRDRSICLAHTTPNRWWQRAYRRLSDACDCLDAMIARTEL